MYHTYGWKASFREAGQVPGQRLAMQVDEVLEVVVHLEADHVLGVVAGPKQKRQLVPLFLRTGSGR